MYNVDDRGRSLERREVVCMLQEAKYYNRYIGIYIDIWGEREGVIYFIWTDEHDHTDSFGLNLCFLTSPFM